MLPSGARRALVQGLEGDRVRGGARRSGQLHHCVQHGELRSARHPHGRFDRRRPLADALQRGVHEAALSRHQGGASHRHRGRVQHPVRARPRLGGLLHHRGERAPLALLRPRLEGDRLPARVRRVQARPRGAAPRRAQHGYQDDDCVLRAVARLLRRQVPALGPEQVPQRVGRPRLGYEVRGRGDGHRTQLCRGDAEGDPHGGAGHARIRAQAALVNGHRRVRHGGVVQARARQPHRPARVGARRGIRVRLHGRPMLPADQDQPLVPLEAAPRAQAALRAQAAHAANRDQ